MNGKQIALLIAATVLVLAGLLTQTALAGSQTIQGITFNGPNTYQQCIDGQTSDTITISGLTGHQPAAQVQGALNEYFILNGGATRQLIATYPVDSKTDVSLKVNYPPVSQWPPNGNPNTREIHVNVAVNVLVNGQVVGEFDGQPNMGWDVYCTTTILTRTPTSTATKTKSVTVTATGTTVLHKGGTVTPTPTETPDRSPNNGPTPTPVVVTPTGPTPAAIPVTGGTADVTMSALGMIFMLGLGLLGAGWALKRAVK